MPKMDFLFLDKLKIELPPPNSWKLRLFEERCVFQFARALFSFYRKILFFPNSWKLCFLKRFFDLQKHYCEGKKKKKHLGLVK